MSLLGPVLLALATYLVMRRRGRVFLEPEEAVLMCAYTVLALVQRAYAGNVNLNDFFVTPLYVALPIMVGHARGSARGASAALMGGWALALSALALAPAAPASPLLAQGFPGQYVILVAVLGITGAAAGMVALPKALKPLLCLGYLLMVASYHQEYMRSLAPYVVLFTAMALSAVGLVLNPFKARPVPTIHYPSSPTRRT